MSDIVERLREFYIPAPDDLPGYDLGICEEAADEIENTAAFLDALAVKLDYLASEYADDCRERAQKLRGEK